MATVFQASFLLVAPFWLLMIAAPGWRVTRNVVGSVWIVVPAALLYLVLVVPDAPGVLRVVASPDLATIAALLATPAGATIAWVHFLAFDLFVGRWVYLDARSRSMPAWLSAPLLLLTLMLGPTGLIGHLIARMRYPLASGRT